MSWKKWLTPRNRFILGLLCLYLGLAFGYGGRREWRRVVERTQLTDRAQLDALVGTEPKTLRLRVPMDGVVRTDVFHESTGDKEPLGRYWVLPLGQRMLLVRSDMYAKLEGELDGALYPLDRIDRNAVSAKIPWPTVYEQAGLPLQKWGQLVPYVFVTPYRPLADALQLGGSMLLAAIGLLLALGGGWRWLRAGTPVGTKAAEVTKSVA